MVLLDRLFLTETVERETMKHVPLPNDWESLETQTASDSARIRIAIVAASMEPFKAAIERDPGSRLIAVKALQMAASNPDVQSALMVADYAIVPHIESTIVPDPATVAASGDSLTTEKGV